MPTYEYRCADCEFQQEIVQKITAEPVKECPACQGFSFRRGPGGGYGLQFKGSGFYITDYATQKGSAPAVQEPSSVGDKGE